jgi:hypothetical protein
MNRMFRRAGVVVLIALFVYPVASNILIGAAVAQSCTVCESSGFEYRYTNYVDVPQCDGNCGLISCVAAIDFYEDSCTSESYWDGPYIVYCRYEFGILDYRCCPFNPIPGLYL